MDQKALFQLSYGLYVLTAQEDGFDNGCIVNTVIQVTDTPNRLSVTVNKANKTHDMLKNTGVFNVSVLTEKTAFQVIKQFGFQSGRDVNKFQEYKQTERSGNGVLYLTEGVNAFISGKVIKEYDLDTHTMFIADITDAQMLSREASLTYDYYQKNVKPKPENKSQGKTAWVCKICGFIYEGEELPPDYICPICKHGVQDFEKIEK